MRDCRFLIVDDDRWFHSIISRVVSKWCSTQKIKPTISFCTDGAQALRYIEEDGLPDCILLDIRMPVMDGKTFMERLCSRNPHLCEIIIAITSASEDEIGNYNGWKHKPAVLLSKSFHPVDIYEALDSIVNRPGD